MFGQLNSCNFDIIRSLHQITNYFMIENGRLDSMEGRDTLLRGESSI